MEDLYGDVLEVWRPWAADLTRRSLESDHHMAEDAPNVLAAMIVTHIATKTYPQKSHAARVAAAVSRVGQALWLG